ncbi:Na+/H+ antiporter subunit E [Staphylococcus pseudintermedius]|uniref:Na+/H+ antiporter subunit E n=1 Tax=Staphylococcus pseudintermedius TaxID=283734 RepID=A0A166MR02_STAPS|nr:Na+/H+ antiporter subunit E [Staphylococcus pseudintermedius]ADV04853.1 Na(+) H(+) antiporter subunit E [Staphylococcus pseudintermedius HKU10-03]ADX77372.1 monovalent cation/H+ antiporter subunit E, putative [Staphylococcus pseudintermedius ED99]ANQ82633.1 cation:proton antiporter [Staphylococcus pseudintermedius]ANQ89140.1 cation:proton antiporter [Staphylococcus pseudintermedius]ANS90522.1 Na(+) H(+) antiporter subunit E [Staphylococcus pseudintermedius]
MRQIGLNVMIAFLWVLFQDEDAFRLTTFVTGYIIGIVVIYIVHKFFDQEFYPKKVWVSIKFLAVYLYQLLTATISITNYVLFKTNQMDPGLVTYETQLDKDWEITFLTILIIITPGSTVIRVNREPSIFLIHAIDTTEKEKKSLLKSIKQYEELIVEVTK